MNVKFVIEGMEETGSNGLDAMILAQRDTFFSDVDYIIISDCGWLSTRPALTYGTRGNCYFFAEVRYCKLCLIHRSHIRAHTLCCFVALVSFGMFAG